MNTQIESDGKTVWVNASDGSCIGRFSRWGIDIHRTGTAQMAGESECLDCTHTKPDIAGWRRFQSGMALHYQIEINDEHMPAFVHK